MRVLSYVLRSSVLLGNKYFFIVIVIIIAIIIVIVIVKNLWTTSCSIMNNMMTSSNGDIFRVTDHLFGEFNSDAELWCYLWSASELMVE